MTPNDTIDGVIKTVEDFASEVVHEARDITLDAQAFFHGFWDYYESHLPDAKKITTDAVAAAALLTDVTGKEKKEFAFGNIVAAYKLAQDVIEVAGVVVGAINVGIEAAYEQQKMNDAAVETPVEPATGV